jgi:hypothetical protein
MNTGRETMRLTWFSPLITVPAAGLLSSLIAVPALALQTSPPSPTPTPPAASSQPGTRVVAVVPAFNVAPFDTRTPLTPREKFHIVWRSTLDPFSLIAPAVKAVIYHGAGLNSGFGSGASGFFKRYGAAVADGASGRFFRTYAYPVLLHEDPRYFRLGAGPKKSRTWYSVNRVFVTRTDAGNDRFNWSKLLGSFTSSGLSNLYYPKENRGAGFTFVGVGFSYLGEASMNLVKEFWPDISGLATSVRRA